MGFGVWGLGSEVWGLRFGVWGLVFGVWGLGFGVWGLGLGFRASGFGFRVSDFGFRVSGFGFRASGFGFRVSGFGFRISDFGFRVSGFWGYGGANGMSACQLSGSVNPSEVELPHRRVGLRPSPGYQRKGREKSQTLGVFPSSPGSRVQGPGARVQGPGFPSDDCPVVRSLFSGGGTTPERSKLEHLPY